MNSEILLKYYYVNKKISENGFDNQPTTKVSVELELFEVNLLSLFKDFKPQ